MLTLIEALMAEYQFPSWEQNGKLYGPDDYVVWRFPLARAFALYEGMRARYGVENEGINYIASAMIAAKRRVEAEWEAKKGDGQF